MIHFLSDQQWIAHWLLYVGPDGGEAVVGTPDPYGFKCEEEGAEDLNGPSVFDVATANACVCSESFNEFLYRYWIENEVGFRMHEGGRLSEEMRHYLEHYRTLGLR